MHECCLAAELGHGSSCPLRVFISFRSMKDSFGCCERATAATTCLDCLAATLTQIPCSCHRDSALLNLHLGVTGIFCTQRRSLQASCGIIGCTASPRRTALPLPQGQASEPCGIIRQNQLPESRKPSKQSLQDCRSESNQGAVGPRAEEFWPAVVQISPQLPSTGCCLTL